MRRSADTAPLVEARDLRKSFPVRRGLFQRAVAHAQVLRGVDLAIDPAEAYALVGESGCGKTTLGRCLIRLIEPTSGSIRFKGEELTELDPGALRRKRRSFQMVFQDLSGSLDPRMRVEAILAEPLAIHEIVERKDRRREVERLLEIVGLPAAARDRRPHEFSGGQRQRIGIARALATRPELLVADEPMSALDVSVQAQIANLLEDLQDRFGLALLFISHDLAIVAEVSDRVGVMYLGRLVEEGPTAAVFEDPQHPYTVSLLSAVPAPGAGIGSRAVRADRRRRIILPGEPPSPTDPPAGCAFHPRCPIAAERCRAEEPVLRASPAGQVAACHFPGELVATGGAGGTF